jgi:catechol 2,3-dioxygenase-like lactoylglutathione lyase family enzyme
MPPLGTNQPHFGLSNAYSFSAAGCSAGADVRPASIAVPGPRTVGVCVHIEHTALIVENYDDAIRFFVDALGFDLVEDSPATTNDGRRKRWVVVRPPQAQTGLLLAEADGERQVDSIGRQYAGRVGLFLRVDDFEATRERMLDHGVEFVTEPRDEPYGRVAVFLDLAGNKWDLLGPPLA